MTSVLDRLRSALADRYAVSREIGSGGMSTVYLADDRKHGRRVALKVLDPKLAALVGPERFLREIEVAARLAHPNILPVFDSGEADGFLYYVMPYVEGESLRERIARDGPLRVEEAVRIACQVGDALGYAHERGVVHRDVKPSNILFEAGHAVVADFGIARATGGPGDERLTAPASTVGTPLYMSPEQANPDGEVDGRADQYALACTLWEMLVGEPPFGGDTPIALMMSHWEAERPSLSSARPDAPEALDPVLRTALSREPGDRYPTARAFADALEEAVSGARRARAVPATLLFYLGGAWLLLEVIGRLVEEYLLPDWVYQGTLALLGIGLPVVLATAFFQAGFHWAPRRARPGLRGLFTWRNAAAGGVLAFALLGVGTTGYAISRTLGVGPGATLLARGELESREPIVLAELGSAPADSDLARTATLLLRIDLTRSPTVRMLEPGQVAETLRRMQVDPETTTLAAPLALEVARREGLKAVLAGELSRAGSSYVLSASLLASASLEPLLAERETAESAEEIPAAVARMSRRLRERIGEPLRSIREQAPLPRVTTPSLEALTLYTRADRAFARDEYERAISLLEEAIALDSTFAMAYRKLSAALFNVHGDADRQAEAERRAFELRDRLPARERLRIEGGYYFLVDNQRAIRAFEGLVELYPESYTGVQQLSTLYLIEGDPRRAEEFARRAIALGDSASPWPFSNAIAAQVARGHLQEALATWEKMAEQLPDHPQVHEEASRLASLRGDYETAARHARVLVERDWRSFWRTVAGHEHLAGLEYVRGRLALGDRHIDSLVALLGREGVETEAQRFVFYRALVHLLAAGDTASALAWTERILERFPFQPSQDPWTAVDLVGLYAAAGRAERARDLVERVETDVRERLRSGDQAVETLLARARGYAALAEGRPREAVEALRRGARATGHLCYGLCVLPWLGRALEEAGRADSAIAVYEEYLTRPMLYRGRIDAVHRGPVLERLGRLYEGRGDRARAIEHYRRLAELWGEGDEAVRPRVRQALERLDALGATRG